MIKETPLGVIDIDPDGVLKVAEQVAVSELGRRLWNEVQSADTWEPPDDGGSLTDLLAREPRHEVQLVDGLLGMTHNASLTAQYKAGKTTSGLNLCGSLADGLPFLGRETHLPEGARVGWWNGEMDGDDWNAYAAPLGISSTDRVEALHLRGRGMPFLVNEACAEWTINWLRDNNVFIWCVDSWRVMCAWNAVHENDNTGGGLLTQRIDEIKRESGVSAFVVLVHTGRSQQAEGEERSRGMTALDDWVDARWVLTKQDQMRFMYAAGRNVDMEETALSFDTATNRLDIRGGTRHDARVVAGVDAVVSAVTASPGMNKTRLKNSLTTVRSISHHDGDLNGYIEAALVQQLVHVVPGPNRQQLHHPGPDPAYPGGMRWAAGLAGETSGA